MIYQEGRHIHKIFVKIYYSSGYIQILIHYEFGSGWNLPYKRSVFYRSPWNPPPPNILVLYMLYLCDFSSYCYSNYSKLKILYSQPDGLLTHHKLRNVTENVSSYFITPPSGNYYYSIAPLISGIRIMQLAGMEGGGEGRLQPPWFKIGIGGLIAPLPSEIPLPSNYVP